MTITALPPRMPRNAPQPRTATDRQLNFIRKLIAERDAADLLPAGFAQDFEDESREGMSGKSASAIIDALTAIRVPRSTQPKVDLEPGMYRKGDVFYRVKVSKAGNWYAQELQRNPHTGRIAFTYRGKIFGLVAEHRLSQDEARQFGVDTGNCICCGAVLTDPKSIEAGIGPICAGKV